MGGNADQQKSVTKGSGATDIVIFQGGTEDAAETRSGGNLENRLTRLETTMDFLTSNLKKLDERSSDTEAGLHRMDVEMAKLTTRVDHLPSKGFIVGSVIIALTLFGALVIFPDQIIALVKR